MQKEVVPIRFYFCEVEVLQCGAHRKTTRNPAIIFESYCNAFSQNKNTNDFDYTDWAK